MISITFVLVSLLFVGLAFCFSADDLQGTWTGKLHTSKLYGYDAADPNDYNYSLQCLDSAMTLDVAMYVSGTYLIVCFPSYNVTINGVTTPEIAWCSPYNITSVDNTHIFAFSEDVETDTCQTLNNVTANSFVMTALYYNLFDFGSQCPDIADVGLVSCIPNNATFDTYYWTKVSNDLVAVTVPGLPYGSTGASILDKLQGTWEMTNHYASGYSDANGTFSCVPTTTQISSVRVVGNNIFRDLKPDVFTYQGETYNSDNVGLLTTPIVGVSGDNVFFEYDFDLWDTACDLYQENPDGSFVVTRVTGSDLSNAQSGCPTPSQAGTVSCDEDTQVQYATWVRTSTSSFGSAPPASKSCTQDYQCGSVPFAFCSSGTCRCRSGFTGSDCSTCSGQIQFSNSGVPSCVALLGSGFPASCSANYQCGNVPYTLCSAGACQCVSTFSGPTCTSCTGTVSWSNGAPLCSAPVATSLSTTSSSSSNACQGLALTQVLRTQWTANGATFYLYDITIGNTGAHAASSAPGTFYITAAAAFQISQSWNLVAQTSADLSRQLVSLPASAIISGTTAGYVASAETVLSC